MRKLLILPIIMAFCVADSGAFAAVARVRNTAASTGATGVKKAVRAATSGAAGTAVNTTGVKKAVRAATSGAAGTTSANKALKSTGAKTAGGKGVRAAATQKVVNFGTKVKTATENTVVDEECQNAYYGCMDAFCMLDNASGGRCQCSDRNKELDAVLDEIMKLDEQSLAMATEGVERIQMGENVDEIMKRAKAAADGVGKENLQVNIKDSTKSSSGGGSKARQLDLSAWKNNSIFSEDDDVFGGGNEESAGVVAGGEFANKFGDDLQIAASGVCVKQLPSQCKNSASFLQLTYGQRIRSDCTAYENSLKQQRAASQEKLATAQKALRDAALESFQNENKYDLGECVVRFKQCLQTTAECGEDYSGCVADTAILSGLYGKKSGNSSKVATTVIKTGATSVTISSATYDILNTKKMMCTSVVKQCVNANKKDAVWQQVIKDLAPVMYTAEYNAASNNRMNCISTVVKCVQTACGSQWDDKSDNYDACLSDPNSIDNYCKLEYNRCGDVASQGNVRSYIMAKLAALKVDKCTTDVKECLLSEDRCGPDYAGCIGLDSDTIVDLCPTDKLLSCQDRTRTDGAAAVREYIAQIAQGLALNIDNKFATVCQNAVDAAYSRVCGAELDSSDEGTDDSASGSDDSCPNLVLSNHETKGEMKWEYCKKDTDECYNDLSYFTNNEDFKSGLIIPRITGRLDGLDKLQFDAKGKCGVTNSKEDEGATSDSYFCIKDNSNPTGSLEELLLSMNRDYGLIMERIASDATVKNCREGRTLQGISTRARDNKNKDEATTIGREEGRFVNILNTAESEISGKVINSVLADYYAELNKLKESGKGDEMFQAISKRRLQIIINEFLLGVLKGTKSLCEMTEQEYTNLMANEELQNTLKNEQDSVNLEECEGTNPTGDYMGGGWRGDDKQWIPGNATKYREDPNFCSKPKGYASSSSQACRNGNAGTQTRRKTPSYDPTTNTCSVKIETYNCKKTGTLRKWRDRCKQWDVNKPDSVETKTYKLPEWNDKGSKYFTKDCK